MSRTIAIADGHGNLVCESCGVAENARTRMRGLLGRTGLVAGEGLLLRPASAVHTWFMRFPIDVVFLDRDLTVLRVAHTLQPWRAARCKGARAVLEVPASTCAEHEIAPGDRLAMMHFDLMEVSGAAG